MTNAVQAAREFLRNALDARSQWDHRPLPSIRILAEQAGVSRETMRRAAHELAQEGSVEISPSLGIRAAGHRAPERMLEHAAERTPRDRWSTVCERLRREILNGTFGPTHTLPAYKELCDTFGVSYRTLYRAIQTLCRQGLLVRYGRGYRVVTHTENRPRNTVVLIVVGDNRGTMRFPHLRSLPNFFSLHNECVSRNLQLEIVTVSPAGDLITCITGDETVLHKGAHHVLGYIVWASFFPKNQLLDFLHARLAPTELPIAFVDDSGDMRPVDRTHGVRWFLPTLGFEAGEMIARTLLQKEHRHVAILHTDSDAGVYRRRAEGIKAVFAAASMESNVLEVKIDPRPPVSHAAMRKLTSQATRNRSDTHTEVWAMRALAEQHFRDIDKLVYGDIIREALMRELTRLIRNTRITAWVGLTDVVGVAAYNFLKSLGDEYERKIAVFGFDNSTDSLCYGLSSFDFNGRALAASAVSYVLRPAHFRGEPNPLVVPGFVVERRSSW
ncbi:MAG: GntR family transcriptional regulator [Chitinivibrionales bacterium]|nr:GntR family transcriptional regulator [Chitinivibrionales bacterium]